MTDKPTAFDSVRDRVADLVRFYATDTITLRAVLDVLEADLERRYRQMESD